MKQLLILFILLLIPSTFAADWRLDMEVGINEDENIEARVDFDNKWITVDAWVRDTDYITADITGRRVCNYILNPQLTWTNGVQYMLTAQGHAFKNHGPYLRYTRIAEYDQQWSAGWKVTLRGN